MNRTPFRLRLAAVLFWCAACPALAQEKAAPPAAQGKAEPSQERPAKKKRPAAPAAAEDEGVFKNLEYAKVGKTALKLDLYLPTKPQGAPLVVWVHGGAWIEGSKDDCPFQWLVHDGYAVASVGYRFSDVALYPAQIHDVRGAVRWLKANASKYGYRADSVGAIGGSAGGHLVMLLATTHGVKELEGDVGGNLDQSSAVQAVISLAGPSDLSEGVNKLLNDPQGPVNRLLGGSAQEKKELARLASPALFVTPDDAPLLILQGGKDEIVPPAQSERIHDAYQKLKLQSELLLFPNAGHGGEDFATLQTLGKVNAFLARNLRDAKPAPASAEPPQ